MADSLRVRQGDGGSWRPLPDARTLWRNEPWLRRLEVLGYGLDAADLAGFTGVIDSFRPPPLPAGVTAALWPRRIALGTPLTVELRVSPATVGRVELRGPGGLEAAAPAEAARQGAVLTARPRAAGRFLYRLLVRDAAGRVEESEPVDVTVTEPRPPRVLARLGAPSFDSRALLRFLAAAGVPYVARLELTRGRAHVEEAWPAGFGEPPAAAPLDAALLARCDVLLLDGRGWQGLGAAERAAATAAVEAGLGVLLFDADPAQGEEEGFPLRSRPMRPPTAAGGAAGREERLGWPGEEPLAPLAVPAREIALPPGAEALASDGGQHVLAARQRRGAGAVALSLAADTYEWPLGADSRSFAALWSRLLGVVARPDDAPAFELPAGPVVADRPADVELLAAAGRQGGGPPRIVAASSADAPEASFARVVTGEGRVATPTDSPPAGNAGADLRTGPATSTTEAAITGTAFELPVVVAGPGRYATRLWPREEGWLRLASSGGAAAWLYAAGPGAWPAWRRAERVAATRKRMAAGAGPPPVAPPTRDVGARDGAPAAPGRPLPRLPFYVLFLAGVGTLWLDERLGGGRPSSVSAVPGH